jgi:hypothetical protein
MGREVRTESIKKAIHFVKECGALEGSIYIATKLFVKVENRDICHVS